MKEVPPGQELVFLSSGFWYDWEQLVSPASQETPEQPPPSGWAEKPPLMKAEFSSRSMLEKSQKTLSPSLVYSNWRTDFSDPPVDILMEMPLPSEVVCIVSVVLSPPELRLFDPPLPVVEAVFWICTSSSRLLMMVTPPPPPPPPEEPELELLGAELVVLEGAGAAVAARARVEARRALEKYIVNVLVVLVWFIEKVE